MQAELPPAGLIILSDRVMSIIIANLHGWMDGL